MCAILYTVILIVIALVLLYYLNTQAKPKLAMSWRREYFRSKNIPRDISEYFFLGDEDELDIRDEPHRIVSSSDDRSYEYERRKLQQLQQNNNYVFASS